MYDDKEARILQVMILPIASSLYWLCVCYMADVKEPWDADAYWHLWYPISLALSAIAGWLLRKHGWLAGAVITFAQLPVMWIDNGIGTLWPAGLVILWALALPATALSAATNWLARRKSSA